MSLAIVTAARVTYDHFADPLERAVRVCNQVCVDLGGAAAGWGLFRKTSGAGWTYQGDIYSLDLIFNRVNREGYDILVDAEGEARPAWQKKTIVDMDAWLTAWRPPIPELLLDPDAPPEPPPDPPPSSLEARVPDLEQQMRLQAAALAALAREMTALTTRVVAL